jgi:hypothetical protein
MSKIYAVTNAADGHRAVRLVKAATKAGAIRHVASDTIAAAIASQETMWDAAKRGIIIEEVGAADPEPAPAGGEA